MKCPKAQQRSGVPEATTEDPGEKNKKRGGGAPKNLKNPVFCRGSGSLKTSAEMAEGEIGGDSGGMKGMIQACLLTNGLTFPDGLEEKTQD